MASVALARRVQQGELGAIDRWLKIVSLRADVLGLHTPVPQRLDVYSFKLEELEAMPDEELATLAASYGLQQREEPSHLLSPGEAAAAAMEDDD